MSIKIKILYALLAIGLIYTVWPTGEERDPSSIRVWGSHVNEQGQLNVLGVVLGSTTLKQAEAALYTQSERALFIELGEDGKPIKEAVEAYFPTSPDRAKIVLELVANAELIDRIKKRSYKAKAFPSGSMKIEIAPDETAMLEDLVARSITYIPPISLTVEMMAQQFGAADQELRDVDGNLHLLYPAIGLDAVIPASGKSLLQFVPPTDFERLTSLIKLPETVPVPQ